jgi:hypothetical protein
MYNNLFSTLLDCKHSQIFKIMSLKQKKKGNKKFVLKIPTYGNQYYCIEDVGVVCKRKIMKRDVAPFKSASVSSNEYTNIKRDNNSIASLGFCLPVAATSYFFSLLYNKPLHFTFFFFFFFSYKQIL